jgi:hypothetical protein
MVSLRRLSDREGVERGDYTMRRVGPLGFSVSVAAGHGLERRVRSTLERLGLPGMELAASSESTGDTDASGLVPSGGGLDASEMLTSRVKCELSRLRRRYR